MSDTEFTNFQNLEKLDNKQLEIMVLEGVNLHIHTSKASAAKRILEKRMRLEQQKQILDTNVIKGNLSSSSSELALIVTNLREVVQILNFFKTRWLPHQPLWVKVTIFIVGTVLLNILLNLVADYISKFVFHW